MNITVLTDNENSWFVKYGKELVAELKKQGHVVSYVHDQNQILEGDICFMLSCVRLVRSQNLIKNRHNLVVHASDLPKGKGFSPLQWQVLEGENDITLTLFEADEKVDSGVYYLKEELSFKGTELLKEMRHLMATKIVSMCLNFVLNKDALVPKKMRGKETFYRRRNRLDDRVDTRKTIEELFNHFRIADNDRFPLFFEYEGCKYLIRIEPLKET